MPLPDSSYRWCVVAYTLLMQGVAFGIVAYSFALLAVPWLGDFGVPRRDVMLAVSLLQIGTGVASPFVGRAMDRIPMRYLVVVGGFLLALGLWLASLASAWWQILVLYGTLFPVAMSLAGTLAAQTLVTRWFTDQRGMAIGISAMGTSVGGVVFPLIVAGWLHDFGWRDTLALLALVSVVLIVPLAWVVLRRNPAPDRLPTDASGLEPLPGWTTRAIVGSRMFWIPVLALLPLSVAFGAVQFNLGAYARDLGLDASLAGRLIALCSVCMVAGKLFYGGLGDRVDHRRLYWLAAVSMATAMAILIGRPTVGALVLGVILVGLAGGGILPLLGVIYGARFGVESFGRVMGLVMLVMTVGAFGPFLAGAIHDAFGSYDWAFGCFLLLFLPGMLVMRWLPPAAVR